MSEVQEYKCPCCGAALVFDGSTQNLQCASCGNAFAVETMKQLGEAQSDAAGQSKYDWEHYTPRLFSGTESDMQLANYSCPSCGAEITGDDTLGATVCPYCGNSTIIKGQFDGAMQPDYVIPFKVDKKSAMAAFEADFKNAPFLPDAFKDKKKIEEMAGVYVPFWMFDCDCDTNITYNAERVTSWSDANYNYVKTDHFKLYRSGSVGFANIPVDGSKKAEDVYMEAIEPYDYRDAVNFNAAYLSGYLADKYDVSMEDSIGRATERVKTSTERAFAQTTSGYTAVTPEASNIHVSDGKIRYALLPVWMLNIRYMENMYKFAINGQTGKVVGVYPIDKKKKRAYFAKVLGISFAIIGAAVYAYLQL